MSLVLFTGGARSGKSSAATDLASRRLRMVHAHGGSVVTVVFGDGIDDEEMAERIARHQAERPEEFQLLEPADPVAWLDTVDPGAVILLDCLGSLLGRLMTAELDREGRDAITERFETFVERLSRRPGDTIVVTNEVGDGVVPAYASGRVFRDLLGRANRILTDRADAAYLVVAGRLIDLNGLPRAAARWPED